MERTKKKLHFYIEEIDNRKDFGTEITVSVTACDK
jgi:hypothetical protein